MPGLGLAGTAVTPPKPRGVPYRAPWEAAQRAAWFGALGHSTEARHALELSQHTLTQASLRTYTGHWRAFARFCAARDLCALPATPETVVLYTAWQAARVKWDGSPALAPKSFQPYLSAISTAHTTCFGADYPPPTQGPWLAAVRRGWLRTWLARGGAQAEVTVALPARVANDAGRALMRDAPSAGLARALCFLVVGFATLMRSSSSVPLARSDVRRTASDVVVRPRTIKGGGINPVLPNPKVFPRKEAWWMHRALEAWEAVRDREWRLVGALPPLADAPRSLWALPGDAASGDDRCAERWLQEALSHLGVLAPMGGKYTPHCLRKGGASAFAAEGGSLGAICYLGDWAVNSPVPEKHYIDRSVLADPFTKLFFSFRVRR